MTERSEVPEASTSPPFQFTIQEDPVPYLFVSSFAEVRKPPSQKSLVSGHPDRQGATSPGQQRRQSQPSIAPDGERPEPQFLVQFPKPVVVEEEGAEPWTLRCVCTDKTEIGLLVQCEKCGYWQHAIHVGLNDRTTPDKYLCEICGKRPIRCKCKNNIDYSVALIQCTSCGYYVHRRCVGLQYGPMPDGDYICNFCGKFKYSYPKRTLPERVAVDDTTCTFTMEKVESINSQILGGPFNDFLTIDIADATLSAREFCEAYYDRFRSFWFVGHPQKGRVRDSQNLNVVSRKKRNNLFLSFLAASEYLCNTFYDIDHDKFTEIFDALLQEDIYKPLTAVKPEEPVAGCEISETVRIKLDPVKHCVRIREDEPRVTLNVTEAGSFAPVDMAEGTFICMVEGFIGDLEEFDYDAGVDYGWYQIADTRCVLDTTRNPGSPLHDMKRSMNGNCILKIIEVGDQISCGLFVGRSLLTTAQKGVEELVVKAGEPLTLGIDFVPAVTEDITKWIGWHCPDLDEHNANRPSRDDRELQAAIRMSKDKIVTEKKVKTPKSSKKKDLVERVSAKKGRPGRKKKTELSDGDAFGLFDLFDTESPLGYLFVVTDDEEEHQRRQAEADQVKLVEVKKQKTPEKHAKPYQTRSSPLKSVADRRQSTPTRSVVPTTPTATTRPSAAPPPSPVPSQQPPPNFVQPARPVNAGTAPSASPPCKSSSTPSLHPVSEAAEPVRDPMFKFVEEAIEVDEHLRDMIEEFVMPDPIQGMRNLLFDTI